MAENRVLNFIDEVDKEKSRVASATASLNTPEFKQRTLDSNMAQAKTDCLQFIFKDLYQNSLPLNDSYINANDDKITADMQDFINRQTANRGIEVYMKEAIKNGNKTLEKVMESVDTFVRNCFREEVVDYKKLNVEDLDWKFDDEKKDALREIARDANLDEVSDIIKNNVMSATEYEKNRIQQKKDEEKAIADELTQNNDVTSESAIETYMAFRNRGMGKEVYQPTLFEGVLNYAFDKYPSETAEEQAQCFREAVSEFTLLNLNKALRFKSYNRNDVNNMAKSYVTEAFHMPKLPFGKKKDEVQKKEIDITKAYLKADINPNIKAALKSVTGAEIPRKEITEYFLGTSKKVDKTAQKLKELLKKKTSDDEATLSDALSKVKIVAKEMQKENQ